MCSPSIHQPAKNSAVVLNLDKKMVLHVEGLLCSPGRGSVAGCRGRNRRQTASTTATGVLLSSTRSKTRGSAGLRQAGGVDNGDSEREEKNLIYYTRDFPYGSSGVLYSRGWYIYIGRKIPHIYIMVLINVAPSTFINRPN